MTDTPPFVNLRFYLASAEPPKEACKPFKRDGGFSGTDINAMWRIKKLTELFGPCGLGWYTEIIGKEILEFDAIHKKCFVEIALYIRDPETGEWSKPIVGLGGNDWIKKRKSGEIVVNDECFKMAETDALGSACKKLGFGASIYWESDPSKYTMDSDGSTVIVPETRAEKIQRVKENDPFYGKPDQSADDEVRQNLAKAEECRKAILDYIDDNYLDLPVVLTEFAQEHGRIDTWQAGLCVRCYKEMKAAGIELREVEL